MNYILLIVFIAIGVYFIFFYKKKSNVADKDSSRQIKTTLEENPYEGLRELAYSTQFNQLNLPEASDKEILYGVLMDWDYDGTIITLVSFKTGDASLYFNTGAAIIGSGQHPEVNDASKAFIDKAEMLLTHTNNVDTALTLEKGFLKFYLLTNKGKYVVKDKMENVINHTSNLNSMFEEANKLIAYIRMAQEKMEEQK